MTKDKKYYQSICVHDFELEHLFRIGESGNMTYETCTICKLNVSRSLKKNPSITQMTYAKITSVEGNVWDVLVQTN